MPLKRQPSDEELNQLAAEFRALWQSGNVIRPWLRKHQARLKTLVGEDWSWATLADALTRAGITYRSKRPWTGDGLKAEVRRAGLPLKRQPFAAPSPTTGQVPVGGPHRHQLPPSGPVPSQFMAARRPPGDPEIAGDNRARSVLRFKPGAIRPPEPPRPLTQDEIEQREVMRKRLR
jgi:hypothetical protein